MPLSARASLALLAVGCSHPDVVLITVDTLRRDHVQAFDPASPSRTPAMDALVADGVAFEQAFSPISVTGPAFCTVLTGQLPSTHGVVMNRFRGGPRLKLDAETLAERLGGQGYATGAFVSGFTLRRELGTDQGFDTYDQPSRRGRIGEETVAASSQWLLQQSGPVFMWVHIFDTHGPLDRWSDVPLDGDWHRGGMNVNRFPHYQLLDDITDPDFYAARYAQAVQYADAQVGKVVAELKRDGRYDDAMIVLLADHGESFTERELWFDHGTSVLDEQLHVPLAIKYPQGRWAGTRVQALVGLQDVAPTVVDVTSPWPWASLGEGRSLDEAEPQGHPWLVGEDSHCKDVPMLSCRPAGPDGKLFVLRTPDHTLFRDLPRGEVAWRVYDRRTDPAELHPVAQQPDPDERVILDDLSAARASLELRWVSPHAVEGDPEAQALKELGYLE